MHRVTGGLMGIVTLRCGHAQLDPESIASVPRELGSNTRNLCQIQGLWVPYPMQSKHVRFDQAGHALLGHVRTRHDVHHLAQPVNKDDNCVSTSYAV